MCFRNYTKLFPFIFFLSQCESIKFSDIFFIFSLCFVPPIEIKRLSTIHSVIVISNITDDFIIIFSVQLCSVVQI